MQTFSFRTIHCHRNLMLVLLRVCVIKCLFLFFLLGCLVHQFVHHDVCISLLWATCQKNFYTYDPQLRTCRGQGLIPRSWTCAFPYFFFVFWVFWAQSFLMKWRKSMLNSRLEANRSLSKVTQYFWSKTLVNTANETNFFLEFLIVMLVNRVI